jgi:hypothetical protein
MLIKSEIVSLINSALGQTAKLRKGGNQLVYFCKCGHRKRKLEVCLEDGSKFGIFSCWVCGKSGNLSKLLKLFNAPQLYREKLHSLIKDIKTIRRGTFKSFSTEVILPDEFCLLSKPSDSVECRNALMYLKRRGVIQEDILRYNIGYCDFGNEYKHHIIIPSYDLNGNLNFFIGRRYYETEGVIPFKKPNVSMDMIGFEIFVNWKEPVILVEGVFNAITIRRNAIPLFGKYPSKKLYESMIINKIKRVYVCLDSDAEKEAIQVCKKLISLGITPYFVDIIGGKDANEIGFEKSWECIKNAKEVDWLFLLNKELEI